MDPGSQVKSLLQFQLGSDNSSVLNLPYCLSTLTSECLLPSAHVAKWTSRITSLMHAKEPGARWAGLCLAYKTSLLSQGIMVDCAQSWVVIALPALSRNEPLPVLKAALRLLGVVFSTATDINEFQRQVTVPNVLKFTSALLSLADNRNEQEIKVLCMKTLAHLVTLYPTTHRASGADLNSFCLRYLNGSSSSWTSTDIMDAASELYSVLHLMGGKVGSVNLWRKSADETLSFGWDAFMSMRTTFNSQDQQHSRFPLTGADPQIVIPLNLRRLRSSVVALCHLLSTIIHRPVHVPIGGLVKFSASLSSCSSEDKIDGFVDPQIHSMEVAVVPEIVLLGCDLLICLARRFSSFLVPHLNSLFAVLVVRLEQKPISHVRLKILQTLASLLEGPCVLESPSLCGRMVKAVLPPIMRLVAPPATNLGTTSSNKTKSGKKRTRNFEGEEILKRSYKIICPTPEDSEAILISVDVLGYLLRNPIMSPAMVSIVARVMLALLVTLPRSTSSLSPDPNFAPILIKRVQALGFRIGSGTTSVMSKALPFIIEAGLSSQESDVQRNLELLLHPRIAPLVRTMPHLESLSLFKAEESNEEAAAFSSLAAVAAQSAQPEDLEEDITMEDISPTATIPVRATAQQLSPAIQPQEASKGASQYKTNDWNQSQQDPEQPISHPVVPNSTAPLISNFGEESRSQATPEPIYPPKTLPLLIPASHEEEEDEMPVINMSSDSEFEEDI